MRYRLLQYGFAAVSVLLALALKLMLTPLLENESPFRLFFVAIILSALYGGGGPGLFATLLAALASGFFFLFPTGSFGFATVSYSPRLVLFVVECVLITAVCTAYRSARARAELALRELKSQRESLHQRDERFRILVDALQDHAIFPVDVDGRVIDWNTGAQRITGYSREEIVGQHFRNFYPAEAIAAGIPETALAQAAHGGFEKETIYLGKDQAPFDARVVIHPIRASTGTVEGFAVVVRDITRHKLQELAIQTSEKRLRQLHAIDQAILAADAPTSISQHVLQAMRQLVPHVRGSVMLFDLDTREAEVLALQVDGEYPIEPGTRVALQAFQQLEQLQHGTFQLIDDISKLDRPSPIMRALNAQGMCSYLSVPLLWQQELLGTLSFAATARNAFTPTHIDIAREVASQLAIVIQQSRLMEEVSTANKQLKALSHRLMETQELERSRLARELHDDAGQMLTALKIMLQLLQRRPECASLASEFEEILGLVQHLLDQIRTLSLNLHPPQLDELGLVSALQWYLERQARLGSFEAYLKAVPENMRATKEIEITCYRIAQEALTNAVRYANARTVVVELYGSASEVSMVIRDDGCGFDVRATREQAIRGGSLGLLGMQERAELIGGQLIIESSYQSGTTVRAHFPLVSSEARLDPKGVPEDDADSCLARR
jgi:PAS domain S-box-containing protein